MHTASPQYDVGVLVGRFQVHELHKGHIDLIEHVLGSHDKVIIFLGVAPLPVSINNPLDFESRKQMILEKFPDVIVLYQPDLPRDDIWSKKLDEQIGNLVTPAQSVVLYGGRDSFMSHYNGRYPTEELLQESFWSGTEVRRAIARSSARSHEAFRAGVIWASQARFPTAYQCVDVAVIDGPTGPGAGRILLGRKSHDKLFRFPGGFSDPSSPSLEADARREVQEEFGVSIEGVRYVGSAVVEDWRYRAEPDCIKTALFRATYTHGRPTPGDDMDAEVRWFNLTDLTEKDIVPQHRPLLALLAADLTKGA